MKIDKKTGEILSFLPQTDKGVGELKTVLDCAINEDVAERGRELNRLYEKGDKCELHSYYMEDFVQ